MCYALMLYYWVKAFAHTFVSVFIHIHIYIYRSALRSITVCVLFFSASLLSLFVGPALFFFFMLFAFLCRWFNVTLTMFTRCFTALFIYIYIHFVFGVLLLAHCCWFIFFFCCFCCCSSLCVYMSRSLSFGRSFVRSMLHLFFFPHCALNTHNMFYIIQILNKHKTNVKRRLRRW